MKFRAKFSIVLVALVLMQGLPIANTGAWFQSSDKGDPGIVNAGSIGAGMSVKFDKLGIPGETITSESLIYMENTGKGDVYCQVSFVPGLERAATDTTDLVLATDSNIIKEMVMINEDERPYPLKEIEGKYYGKLPKGAGSDIGFLKITFMGEEIDLTKHDGNDFQDDPFAVTTQFKICQANDTAAAEAFGIADLSTKLQTQP